MQIFLDTANIEEIRRAASLGVVSGVTTNPSLVAKEGRGDLKAAVQEIASIISGPISAEVLNLDSVESIIQNAREVASWAPNVVVKVPITAVGLSATSVLAKESIKTNLTLCFSANQALLAALAGATYVSPFVGRLDDVGHDGMALVADIVEIFAKYKLPTKVIAASIRHIATVPYQVLMQMMQHPLTDVGIRRFAEDWQRVLRR